MHFFNNTPGNYTDIPNNYTNQTKGKHSDFCIDVCVIPRLVCLTRQSGETTGMKGDEQARANSLLLITMILPHAIHTL